MERGGADAAVWAFPSKFRRLNLSPHPSRELLSVLQCVLVGEIGGEGEGGGSGMGGGWTNRNGVDLRFKLRSPSKIMFDMNAGWLDRIIKI